MQKMGVASCLIMAAHYAKGHDCTPLLAQHARNDGVQRPLSRRDRVRMPWDQLEARAAVVQQHAAFRRKNAAAEGKKERVDQGNRVAIAINYAKVSRVLVLDTEARGRLGCPLQ